MKEEKTLTEGFSKQLIVFGGLFFLFVICPAHCFSDESDSHLIYHNGGVYDKSSGVIVHGQMSYDHRYTYNELEYFMKDDSEALGYLKKSQTYNSLTTAFFIPAIAGITVSGLMISADKLGIIDLENDHFPLFAISTGTGLVFFVAALIVAPKSGTNLLQAVEVFNKNRQNQSNGNDISVSVAFSEDGIGLRLRF